MDIELELELEKLSKLGAQKISEDTHIPVQHIKALLSSTFNSFSRVQFLGFISILQREYGDKLTAIKSKGIEYFDEIDTQNTDDGLLVVSTRTETKTSSYFLIILTLFTVGLLYTLGVFEEKTVPKHKIDNSKIEKIHKNIELEKSVNVIELNATQLTQDITTQDTNTSSIQEIVQAPVALEKSFNIVTKSKTWIGYINLTTEKKHQTIFTDTLQLDPQQDWLLDRKSVV